MKKRKKFGLALGSGAVKGLFHVGVLRSLVKHNIPIDYIAGTSAGAIAGAHFALYRDVEKLEKFVLDNKLQALKTFLEPNWGGGFIKGKKMQDWLRQAYGHREFSDLLIPFRSVATNLLTGTPEVLSRGRLVNAVYASMAIPGLFEPAKIDNKIMVDGFLCNPVPDDVVKKMGADVILAVNLDNYAETQVFKKNKIHVSQVTWRSFEIMRHFIANYSVTSADWLLVPKGLNRYESWADYFLGRGTRELIALGEQETDKLIPAIKRRLSS